MNFRYILFIGILAFLICSCSSETGQKKSTSKDKLVNYIEGIVVKPSVLQQTIKVSGTVEPFEETILMPDLAGRVVAINFQEGMFVKKGTLLIQLFNDDMQAELNKLKAQLDIAEQTEKRQNELKTVNGISQQEYDQVVLQVHSIKADIEVVRAQLRKYEILAPFDGVLGLRNISIGAVVTPNTALSTIRQVNQLKVTFSFPEKYSYDIKKGTKIKFTVQGNENRFEAIVIATEGGIDPGTRNLKARALINNIKAELVPGQYANVELQLKENNDALMIPTQAIIPQEQNKKLIVSKMGKATFIIVKTGVRQASNIEIISGIEPGDTVVTTGIQFIKPGSGLKFAKVIN
jgi:membrane fusion protein, multidrug efflux system